METVLCCPACRGTKYGWLDDERIECRECEGIGEIPDTLGEGDLLLLPDLEPPTGDEMPTIAQANVRYLTEDDFGWSAAVIADLIERCSVDGPETVASVPAELLAA